MISRAGWGAKAPKSGVQTVAAKSRTEFVVHHSGGPAGQSVREIQNHCMDSRGFLDIDYNFLVDQAGKVYVGRGWNAVGSHTSGHNSSGWGVCVIGNNDLSTAAAESLQALYAEACKRAGKTLAMRVHSDLDSTACPGAKIREFVKAGKLNDRMSGAKAATPRDLSLKAPHMTGADVEVVQRKVGVRVDGIFGPVTAAGVERYQRANGLAVDGIVGPKTRAKMGIK